MRSQEAALSSSYFPPERIVIHPAPGTEYLADSNTVVSIDHDDITSGNDAVIHHHLDRLVDYPVQLDNGTRRQLEHVLERQPGFAERNANRKFHIKEYAHSGPR